MMIRTQGYGRACLLGLPIFLALFSSAEAELFYRVTQGTRTIGFLHQSDTEKGTWEGRQVEIRSSRMSVLASYVGTKELHNLRETTLVDIRTGKIVFHKIEYAERHNEEVRKARFVGGIAKLELLRDGRAYKQHEIKLPEGVFIRAGLDSLRDILLSGKPGKPFQVLDPRSLETSTGVIGSPREETIDVNGTRTPCRAQELTMGEQKWTIHLAFQDHAIVRVTKKEATTVTFSLSDDGVVREIEGIDVSAPPLGRIRDLPWTFDQEYRFDFFVSGEPSGWVKFTPTLITVDGQKMIALVSKISITMNGRYWKSSSATHYDGDLRPRFFEYSGTEERMGKIFDTSIQLRFRDGQVHSLYKSRNQILEKSPQVPQGCHVVHNNNMEHFAFFLSQIDMARGCTTRINGYHPRLFKGFIMEVEAGATRTVNGRQLTSAHLESELFQAEIVLDEQGRLLSYGKDTWEFRLRE